MATDKSGDKANTASAAALRQYVVDKTVEKATAKINQKSQRLNDQMARKADQIARKAARHIESLDRLAAHLEALEVWTRAEPGSRKPRFSREEIATVAIAIADAEGFDAVSMRRIAAELDAGTMTLYHYVRTKDELLALVIDTILEEVLVPEGEMPDDWREAVSTIARRSRDSVLRHPWILDISDDPNFGPNSVRHFDQSLRAVSSLRISLRDKLDIITAVDEYVFGYCQHMRTNFHEDLDASSDPMRTYVMDLLATGEYEHVAAVVGELGIDEAWNQIHNHAYDPNRFDRNLARLLDGIEADFT